MISKEQIESMSLEETRQHCLDMAGLISNAAFRFVLGRGKRPAHVAIRDGFGIGILTAHTLCDRLQIDHETGERK